MTNKKNVILSKWNTHLWCGQGDITNLFFVCKIFRCIAAEQAWVSTTQKPNTQTELNH